jgi:hypothetical protein
MRLRLAAAAFLLAATPAAAQESLQGEAPSDAAVAAIAMPEQQLRGLLARVLFGTQTSVVAMEAMGITPFCKVAVPAIDTAVAEHLPVWRENLVTAYRDNVPVEVLAEAASKPAEAARPLLAPHLEAVGVAMNKASAPVLKEAAGEVLARINAEAPNYDIKTVDLEARRAELKAGAADGSLFCGLLGGPGDRK